jgi:predicted DNA binding CopG/RHH family protein
MKKTKSRITYKDEPKEEGWEFNPSAAAIDERAASKLGIPTHSQARAHLRRKQTKETRINVRLSANTLAGLKQKAEEAGMPYQTLAAAALHMLATGKLRLAVVSETV